MESSSYASKTGRSSIIMDAGVKSSPSSSSTSRATRRVSHAYAAAGHSGTILTDTSPKSLFGKRVRYEVQLVHFPIQRETITRCIDVICVYICQRMCVCVCVCVHTRSSTRLRGRSHTNQICPCILVRACGCAGVCLRRNALKRMSNFPSHQNRSERHSQLFRAGRHGIGSAAASNEGKECQRKLAYTVEDRRKSQQAYGFLKRQDDTKLQTSLTTSDGRIMQLDEKFETTSRPFTEVRKTTPSDWMEIP